MKLVLEFLQDGKGTPGGFSFPFFSRLRCGKYTRKGEPYEYSQCIGSGNNVFP